MSKPNGDLVDEAIAAVEAPKPVAMVQHTVTISSTQRPFGVLFPQDITDEEIMEVASWLTSPVGFAGMVRQQRGSKGRIILARA